MLESVFAASEKTKGSVVMKKRILVLALAAAMILCLFAGCGQ